METPKIYSAIADIMAEGAVIGKNSKNSQQGFMYRGVDAVMNVFQPLLAKHRVFVLPEILEQTREERKTKSGNTLIYTLLTMRYTFYADDGSNVQSVVVGEAMDSADKSCNKAMSVAFKYAMFQAFCIPTEEMIDPDSECHESSKPVKYACADCGKKITGDGKYSALQIYNTLIKRSPDGVARCKDCREKHESENKTNINNLMED